MKRSKFTDEPIIAILREQEERVKTAEVCRRHGMRQDAMPKRSLGTRNDLVSLGQFLNVRRAGNQGVMEEPQGADLQHLQDDLGILRIVLVPAVVQGLKLIYLAIRNFEKDGRNVREWFSARKQFAIMFDQRFGA